MTEKSAVLIVEAGPGGAREALTDGDLQMPYRRYLPEDSPDEDDRRTIDVVYANTANHYGEHLVWIEALVGE